jgi:hypothetical protein
MPRQGLAAVIGDSLLSGPQISSAMSHCTSAAEEPVVGPAAVRHLFNTTRTMYDRLANLRTSQPTLAHGDERVDERSLLARLRCHHLCR